MYDDDDEQPKPKVNGKRLEAFERSRQRASQRGGEVQRAAKVVVTLPRAPWEWRDDGATGG